jgi:hypothetical protein
MKKVLMKILQNNNLTQKCFLAGSCSETVPKIRRIIDTQFPNNYSIACSKIAIPAAKRVPKKLFSPPPNPSLAAFI